VSDEHLGLLVKVARMYYERRMRQQDIADALAISQAKVSRLLKEATERGIVRSIVDVPPGVHADLEEQLGLALGLRDVIVVETDGASDVTPAIGSAAASYLSGTLKGGEVIGISSWSGSLLAAVNAMRTRVGRNSDRVIQMFGGVGSPESQLQATRLVTQLARVTGAEPVFMPAPAVVGHAKIQQALSGDPDVKAVAAQWDEITVSLVGIGTLEPSPLLARSGNAVTADEREELSRRGAVGDVCLRFFDGIGEPIDSSFDKRVIGMKPAALKKVPRRVGVAGGASKVEAIRAAAIGGWINVLITDSDTATQLAALGT
jgi:DNA-binding transcriptional regulator LsrR (DeoR family)